MVAPRVEKTEVFKKGGNFARLTCFENFIVIFIKEERNGVSSLVFTMKLFSAVLSYLTAHSTLDFVIIRGVRRVLKSYGRM